MQERLGTGWQVRREPENIGKGRYGWLSNVLQVWQVTLRIVQFGLGMAGGVMRCRERCDVDCYV